MAKRGLSVSHSDKRLDIVRLRGKLLNAHGCEEWTGLGVEGLSRGERMWKIFVLVYMYMF